MPFLDFPNELLLLVSANITRPRDIYALLRANQRLSHLLLPHLHRLAVQDKDGMNALLWASLHGHDGLIAHTLAAGFGVNVRGRADDYDGKTPLYRAVQSGSLTAVKLLLAHGADPYVPTFTYATPLHEAAGYGSEDMVALILAADDAVIEIDMHNSTPLHWAAAGKRSGNLRVIFEHSRRTHNSIDRADLSGNTALHSALALTVHRHSTPADDVSRLLLANGANPNAVNFAGCTPLYIAVKLGLSSIVTLLLSHGADPHAAGYSRHTPLHHVARSDNISIATLLIDGGASPAYPDQQGHTSLDLAFESAGRYPACVTMVQLLLERSEGIALGDKAKRRILWWASKKGLENMVRLLLRRGIAQLINRENEETMMQWAVRRGDEMVIRVLQEMEEEQMAEGAAEEGVSS